MNNAKKFPWYTGRGDDGETRLLGDDKVMKYHAQPDTYGTVDEATSSLGMARALTEDSEMKEITLNVQHDLYCIMSDLASTPETIDRYEFKDLSRLSWLETTTDDIGDKMEMPKAFVVPGNSVPGAAFDIARTVVRRAERKVVSLIVKGYCSNPLIVRYLNRLSSLCFVMARYEDSLAGIPVTLAKETQSSDEKSG